MDSGILLARYQEQTAANNAFIAARKTYDSQKNTFERALDLEKQRLQSLYKALFEDPLPVPLRPCPPTQP
jgi:hypothetical protein